jgi:hypothetical protein
MHTSMEGSPHMKSWTRSNLPTVIAMLLTAAIVGAPALAGGGFDASNAHKVDGRHAVGAGSSRANAAGKLVAADNDGRFDKKFLPAGLAKTTFGGFHSIDGGATGVLLTLPGAGSFSVTCNAGTSETTFDPVPAAYGWSVVQTNGTATAVFTDSESESVALPDIARQVWEVAEARATVTITNNYGIGAADVCDITSHAIKY